MSSLSHPPVQKAIGKLRAMSADEEERYWAEAREKALRDEVTLLAVAREEGLEEGLEKGREEGLEKGREEATRETARNLIQLGALSDAQIAQATGLTRAQVEALRAIDPQP
jgi:predicted transposase/invertase (TIGR01784 family)